MTSIKIKNTNNHLTSRNLIPLLYTSTTLSEQGVGQGRRSYMMCFLFLFPFYIFSQTPDSTFNLKNGIVKYNEGNYEVALLEFNKAAELTTKNAEVYYYLGETYLMQNEPKRAMENYNKSIDLDSLFSKAYKGRGKLKAKLEDFMGSIDDFNIAIKQNKNFSDAYFNRASSYLYLKDYKASIADYTKVIELNKKDFQAYEQRGTAKFQAGDTKGACKDWSKAGELGDFKIYDIIKKNCK